MDREDWSEIRELRLEKMGTKQGISLGNLIAEDKLFKQKLEKIEQIVNGELQIMESDLLWKIREVLENG